MTRIRIVLCLVAIIFSIFLLKSFSSKRPSLERVPVDKLVSLASAERPETWAGLNLKRHRSRPKQLVSGNLSVTVDVVASTVRVRVSPGGDEIVIPLEQARYEDAFFTQNPQGDNQLLCLEVRPTTGHKLCAHRLFYTVDADGRLAPRFMETPEGPFRYVPFDARRLLGSPPSELGRKIYIEVTEW